MTNIISYRKCITYNILLILTISVNKGMELEIFFDENFQILVSKYYMYYFKTNL